MAELKTFMVEGAELLFKNFAGAQSQYNDLGERNFNVKLDEETAARLLAEGWNVKRLRGDEDHEVGDPILKVSVSFKNKPPLIVVMTSVSRVICTEDMLEMLDYADMANVDFIATGYDWNVRDAKGVKAYLKSMYITLAEDYLTRKYAIDQAEPMRELNSGD